MIKFSIIFIYFFAVIFNLKADDNYDLIDKSYKEFLQTKPKNEFDFPTQPCAYIYEIQRKFLASETQEQAKYYRKLIRLADNDGFYFTYKKQSVKKDQIDILYALFERSKIFINYPVHESHYKNNVYSNTNFEHLEILLSGGTIYGWKDIKNSNPVNDNLWILLWKNSSDKKLRQRIECIKDLPLSITDVVPQFILNIAGSIYGKSAFALYKKDLDPSMIKQPFFEQDLLIVGDEENFTVYHKELSVIKINSEEDLEEEIPEGLTAFLKINLDTEKINKIKFKSFLDKVSTLNVCSVELNLSLYDDTILALIEDFFALMPALHDLTLNLKNNSNTPLKVLGLKKLEKLTFCDFEFDGYFDLMTLGDELKELKNITEMLLDHNNFDLSNVKVIYDSIQSFKNLTSLSLNLVTDKNFTYDDGKNLSNLLDECRNLNFFYYYCQIFINDYKNYLPLIEAISKKSIKDLNLVICKKPNHEGFISEENLLKTLEYCGKLRKLKNFDLVLPALQTGKSFEGLSSMLNNLKKLNSFKLSLTEYDRKLLNLEPNQISSSLEKFIKSLLDLKNLNNLSLYINNINKKEKIYLIQNLNHMNLELLGLFGNIIDGNNIESLSEVIKSKKNQLKSLSLNLGFNCNDLELNNFLDSIKSLENLKNLELLIPSHFSNQSLFPDFVSIQNHPLYQNLRNLIENLKNLENQKIIFCSSPFKNDIEEDLNASMQYIFGD